MFAVVALTVTALVLRLRGFASRPGTKRWIYLAVVAAAAALISWGGHLGGEMVFGEPPPLAS